MGQRTIPGGPQDLTPAWLTDALRSTGAIGKAAVTAFDAKTIAEGAGLLGQLAFVSLTYDQAEEGTPQKLIAKFPAAAEENRQNGMMFKFYERENNFYDLIADSIELGTARCYYSAMEPEEGQHVLLLEDLSDYRVGDQIAGCSPDDAALAIEELAKFHAGWWESPRLGDVEWIPVISDPIVTEPAHEAYNQAWEPFLENLGGALSPEIVDAGERLGASLRGLLTEFDQAPRTFAHGDFRFDNMFFADGTAASPESKPASAIAEAFKLIDWQLCVRGRGTFDIGYFMSQSAPPDFRRAAEMDLLHRYHDVLTEHGITGYSFDECLEDYRRAVMGCLIYPVVSGGSFDLSNERGRALVEAMRDRSVTAIVELNADELLPA